MTTRLEGLPRGPDALARRVAALEEALAQLRARTPDMSAADGMLQPLDADPTRWPQTTSASYATIASCSAIWHGGLLRLALATTTSGGSTGNVRVMVGGYQWGPITVAGSIFDYTGTLPVDAAVTLGDQFLLTVEAQRTGGGGSVYAQTTLIRQIP